MAPQSFQLVMRTEPNLGKAFPLEKGELLVGRDAACDIAISDAEISRKHARLVLQGDSYTIEDLGSTNGTFVNGQRLMGPHVLRPGELIMFGENIGLVFEATGGYDANATVVSAGLPGMVSTMPAVQPAPPAYTPPAYVPSPPSQPAYVGQVPAGPMVEQPMPAEPPKKNNKVWLFAGCGCLILLVLCCVVVFYSIDAMNLYCKPPLNTIFQIFVTCP